MILPAASTAGAVRLTRLLHRDAVASVHTGFLDEGRRSVVVTLARHRVDGTAREVFLDWGARLTHLSAHPHIVPIEAVGLTEDAHPYLAVHASRTTLADELRESGPPPAGQVRALGVALADTLAAIHGSGLIHGALQPATMLYGPSRKLLIAGFDATAPMLAHSLPPGPYTAPEHLEAAKAGSVHASPAGDVHNLATLLYTALGGRLPWLTSQGQDSTDPLLRAAPIPDIPGVSIALTDVLGSAMSADPRQRPDASKLRDLLSNADVSRPLAAGRRPGSVVAELVPRSGPRPTAQPGGADVAIPAAPQRTRRSFRLSRPLKLAASTLAGLAVIAGAGLATFAVTHADPASECPTDAELADAIGEVTITDKQCSEAATGYVAVTAQHDKETRSASGSEGAVRVALQDTGGTWRVMDDCDGSIPASLRDYLDC